MSFRTDRLNSEMRKVIADVIDNKIKDPRVTQMVSVTNVEVAKDLKTAKVYLSISATKKSARLRSKQSKTLRALSARNFPLRFRI